MASLKISEVLNRLGMKSLRELSRKRDLEGLRETSESLASRLAKSYKGDFNALLKDLTRHDFMRIFAQPLRIGKIQCELRNKSHHNLPDFQRIAHQVFVDGIVAQEFNVLDEPLVKSPKELEATLRENGNSLKNEDLSYRDLSGFNFSGCDLSGVNFSHSNLRSANFDRASLRDVKMIAADIHGSSWKGTKLFDVSLGDVSSVFDCIGERNALEGIQVQFGPNNSYDDYSNLNLRGSVLLGYLFDPNFQGSDLTAAKIAIDYFGGINFDQAKFKNAEITKLDGDGEGKDSFRGAVFEATKFLGKFQFMDSDFTEASFVEIKFSGTSFFDCNFENTRFENCDFDDVGFFRILFKGIDFSGQTFRQAVFENCSFTECDFSECEISGSQFTGCTVLRSNFSNAQMEGVTISQDCHFEECDFNGARLTKAEIEDVYLSQPFAFIGATIL